MFDIFSEDQNIEYPFTNEGEEYIRDRIEQGFAYVAKEKSRIVGFLTGSIEKAIEFKTYDRYGFIENMYILDEYRRMGVGRMLIERLVETCKDYGIRYIHTDSDADQYLINFYTSLGFKVSGVNYKMKL